MTQPLWTDEYLGFFFDESHKNHVVVAKKMRDEYEGRLALASDQITSLSTENAALRTELAAAMNEIASHNMTIKTLSEHIVNTVGDGEEWLNSYIGTGEISE